MHASIERIRCVKKKFYDIQLSNESRWVCKNNNVQNVSSRDINFEKNGGKVPIKCEQRKKKVDNADNNA